MCIYGQFSLIILYRSIFITPEQMALFQAVRNTGAGTEDMVRAALTAFGADLRKY